MAPAIERVTRRTGHTPRAVTTDRGYAQASVERDLHDLGVRSVAIPRKSKPTASAASSNTDAPSARRSSGGPD